MTKKLKTFNASLSITPTIFGSVCVCVCNVGRSSTLLTLRLHKTLCGGHLRACEMMTYFLSCIWLPGFIKIGSKEASFPFDFNEGSVADRRLLIYTLLLRALRQTEQDPAVASHSYTHTHSHTPPPLCSTSSSIIHSQIWRAWDIHWCKNE